jgi:hypothetical protein
VLNWLGQSDGGGSFDRLVEANHRSNLPLRCARGPSYSQRPRSDKEHRRAIWSQES